MKKIAFLVSHLHSGSTQFLQVLASNPRVQCYRTNVMYSHPTQLELLIDKPHKCNNAGAVYVEETLYNHQISCKRILELCKFIYVVREPNKTLQEIIASGTYQPLQAARYYCFRLRRLSEMAKKTPGAILLTRDDLIKGSGLPLIEKYLQLKQPLRSEPTLYRATAGEYTVGEEILRPCENAYEKYLYKMRAAGLVGTH